MATTLEQNPLYEINPATFKWIYIWRNDAIVSGVPTPYWNVSYYAAIFLSPSYTNLGSMNSLIAETKTIPNNAGVGVFNFQRFFESYVAPQYNNYYDPYSSRIVRWHGVASSDTIYFPIHVIDNFSQNDDCFRYVEARCQLEGSAQPNLPAQAISGTTGPSIKSAVFNGYLQNEFPLSKIGTDFGYDYETEYAPLNQYSYGILSDVPRDPNAIGVMTKQYANKNDYGVFSFFNQIFTNFNKPDGVEIMGYFSDGSTDSFTIENIDANGGTTTTNPGVAYSFESILFFGVFPGNLRQAHSTFRGWLNGVEGKKELECYTFRLVGENRPPDDPDPSDPAEEEEHDGGDHATPPPKSGDTRSEDEPQPVCALCSEDRKWKYDEKGECSYDTREDCERANYRCEQCKEEGGWRWGPDGDCIYATERDCEERHPSEASKYLSMPHMICLTCPSSKGYEPVRITWLNSMGGWDYYTFNMKSKKSIKTKRNDWTQLEGSWNKESWNPQGWKGGKKAFTVNAKNTIEVNSDYISEEVAEWFGKLINSPEIYILQPHEEWRSNSDIFHKYEKHVKSVRLLTSSYKIKTRANDNVIQYSFKFEESRTLNTQPI